MEQKPLKLIRMQDVAVEKVRWVWYPYIPFGKITIIQGDPGEGKTSFVLALVSLLTKGEPPPGLETVYPPLSVIY